MESPNLNRYKDLVTEITAWETKNWGTHKQIEDGFKYAHQPLLGIVEELGELASLEKNIENIIDSVGDVMIFMVDYCSCMDIYFPQIMAFDFYKISVSHRKLLAKAGSLCHHHLKLEQNIRGSRDIHYRSIILLLSEIINVLYNLCWNEGLDFERCIFDTWNEVKKRDWKSNKEEGV